jgi:hypothetical protein
VVLQLLSQALGQSMPHQRCIPRLHVIIRFDHAAAALLATDFPSRLAFLTAGNLSLTPTPTLPTLTMGF